MIFPALLAKLLSAGAVAQAATGATVVVVAFAGAGAAGVLPGPVQDTFTSIVSDETEELPTEETPVEEAPVAEEPIEEAPVVEEPVGEAPVAEEEPTPLEAWMTADIDGSFGDWVTWARHDADIMAEIEESGENFGFYVSQRAKDKGLTAADLAEEGIDLEALNEDGTVVQETPEVDASEDEVVENSDDRGNRGNGNGRGNGGGNGNGNGRN